jgi:hypothetical protein
METILTTYRGPGTGKTLTAERYKSCRSPKTKGRSRLIVLRSVAEIAEKPLYRVTCGDIGTDPEDVEKVEYSQDDYRYLFYFDRLLRSFSIWKVYCISGKFGTAVSVHTLFFRGDITSQHELTLQSRAS